MSLSHTVSREGGTEMETSTWVMTWKDETNEPASETKATNQNHQIHRPSHQGGAHHVVVVDHHGMARMMGHSWRHRGVDVAFESSCAPF